MANEKAKLEALKQASLYAEAVFGGISIDDRQAHAELSSHLANLTSAASMAHAFESLQQACRYCAAHRDVPVVRAVYLLLKEGLDEVMRIEVES